MTGWAGPAREPTPDEHLGFLSSLAVILLPWLDPQARQLPGPQASQLRDGPCVRVTEAELEAEPW